ncbi:hypothetical protein DFH11DRAFT_1501391, partial [Phellopilus nigrolimitatus]
GIRLIIGSALENNGATVYILGRRLGMLQKSAKEHKYEKLNPLHCDVTSQKKLAFCEIWASLRPSSSTVISNVLINNAGVMYNFAKAPNPTDDIKAFQEKLWSAGTPEESSKTFHVSTSQPCTTQPSPSSSSSMHAASPDEPMSQMITMISSIGEFRRVEFVLSISYSASKAVSNHVGKLPAKSTQMMEDPQRRI